MKKIEARRNKISVRIHDLISKIISFKGLAFITGTILLCLKHIDGLMWLTLTAGLVGVRTFEKRMNPGEINGNFPLDEV